MLFFIGSIIITIISITHISGVENSYVGCQLLGDPRIQPFPFNESTTIVSTSCGLRNQPVTFFRNRFMRIEVVNNGTATGNIVSFTVTLLDDFESDEDVCTFTEQYFNYPRRVYKCGLANITINEYIQIQNREAELFVTIYKYGSYEIHLQTSLENANRSKGLCHDGCTSAYTTNVYSRALPSFPQDRITSLLAGKICNIYLKDYIKPNTAIPMKLIPFVETTYQGCITDITTMGDKRYAEQALISIVSTLMTFNATSFEQIQKRTQEALAIVDHLSKIADQITSQLVATQRANNE